MSIGEIVTCITVVSAAIAFLLIKRSSIKVLVEAKAKVKSSEPSEMEQSKLLVGQIREIITTQILNNHTKLFSAVAKQKEILNKQNRSVIAIFISPLIFKELITNSGTYIPEMVEGLYETMRDLRMPVGFLGDFPIYISDAMGDTPVFVTGSISWTM